MTSFIEMIENITPEIYQNLKQSVELGKWPNGKLLTKDQKETCLQAIIAWEIKHLPEHQRTGYMEGASCQSDQSSKGKIIIKSDMIH